MPTARTGYYLKDGTRVPSVTTIIGRFKNSSALIKWANKQGLAGIDIEDTKREAADIGTIAHEMVEQSLSGADEIICPFDAYDEEKGKAAWSAYNAYEKWANGCELQIIASEIHLVSEEFRFGGTPDAIGLVGGDLSLLDWKTSNALYADYLIQIAAYRQLWNENNPDKQLTPGGHILRFAKEFGDFTHKWVSDLDDAWMQFRLFRKAYEIDKRLEKRVK